MPSIRQSRTWFPTLSHSDVPIIIHSWQHWWGTGPPVFADTAPGDPSPLNKRCCSKKICDELNLQLRFPTVAEGLPHAVGASER